MKYLPLVWAGLWRKRARTVLTAKSTSSAGPSPYQVQATTPTSAGIVAWSRRRRRLACWGEGADR